MAIRCSRSGWPDVGHHAPLEAAHQPGLEARDLLGRPVGGQDDLLVALVERVERVEELLLRHFLAFQEMHVVHQEEVHVGPIAAPELRHGPAVDALDHLVDELLGADVEDPGLGLPLAHAVGDGLHQVGLAEPGGTVDEERVVGLARRLGDGVGRGGRELVGLADDEGVEGVALVERLGAGIGSLAADSPSAAVGGDGRSDEEVHLGPLLPVLVHPEDDRRGLAEHRLGQLATSSGACFVSFHSTAN